MFARIALATMLFAAAPLVGADIADAKGKGKRDKGQQTVNIAKKSNKKANNNSNRIVIVYNGAKRAWYGWGGQRRHGFKCVAAAKTRGGFGRRIPGIRGKSFGHKACKRAMRKCRIDLRHRKATGRNPFARCVVVKRG